MGKIGIEQSLLRILVLSPDEYKADRLSSVLSRLGFECLHGSLTTNLKQKPGGLEIDVAVVSIDSSLAHGSIESIWQEVEQMKSSHDLPVIAIISDDFLDRIINFHAIDDFITEPWNISELNTRIRRVAGRRNNGEKANGSTEEIYIGDLQIDIASCEVTLCGKKLALTFKEYELLTFMARNRGRVFTRDVLLNEVWGYDYYGGDRTVDVHIRRLRIKIEDAEHTFIETIRQVGYRFRGDN